MKYMEQKSKGRMYSVVMLTLSAAFWSYAVWIGVFRTQPATKYECIGMFLLVFAILALDTWRSFKALK